MSAHQKSEKHGESSRTLAANDTEFGSSELYKYRLCYCGECHAPLSERRGSLWQKALSHIRFGGKK